MFTLVLFARIFASTDVQEHQTELVAPMPEITEVNPDIAAPSTPPQTQTHSQDQSEEDTALQPAPEAPLPSAFMADVIEFNLKMATIQEKQFILEQLDDLQRRYWHGSYHPDFELVADALLTIFRGFQSDPELYTPFLSIAKFVTSGFVDMEDTIQVFKNLYKARGLLQIKKKENYQILAIASKDNGLLAYPQNMLYLSTGAIWSTICYWKYVIKKLQCVLAICNNVRQP